MSVTLNQAAFTQATGRQERLQAFDQLSQSDAQQILKGLHTDLQRKPGVLRLLHTSHADKPMKFQRAGGFKQFFLKGEKLERSSEALTNLLRRSGLAEDKVQQFEAYAQSRGRRGVETSKLMAYLNEAVDFTAPNMETALVQLGVSTPANRVFLGEGGFGAAYKVSYQGQDQVLKLFTGGDEESRRVVVRDDAHSDEDVLKMLRGEDAPRSNSFVAVEDDPAEDAAGVLAAAVKQAPAKGLANSYMPSSEPANSLLQPDYLADAVEGDDIYDSDKPGDDIDDSGKPGDEVSHARLSKQADAIVDDDAQSQGMDEQDYADQFQAYQRAEMRPSVASSQAGDDEANLEGADPEDISVGRPSIGGGGQSVRSFNSADFEPQAQAVAQADAQLQAPVAPREPKGVHLGRTNITNAVRLKDMPGIVAPSRLLVRETLPDGQEVVHAVRGGAAFKAWARTRGVGADLVVIGSLMPMAPGKSPVDYTLNENEIVDSRAQIEPAQVRSMAKSGIDILKGLQARGFIHGDIKPANMLYSAEDKALNLIDTDDLRKISKRPEARLPEKPGTGSMTYIHPGAYDHKGCGAGRDLYALGVSLLETSLLSRGEKSEWDTWFSQLSSGSLSGILGVHGRKALAQQARNNSFPPDSAEHFALQCIAESLEYEAGRVAQGLQGRFERYTPDNPAHPLNKVSQHPFLA